MKLKKKTSILMAATAAVATVGIAAVSFAAWQGTSAPVVANAATGTVVLEGITTEDNLDFTLVPYDQDDASIRTGTKYACIELSVVAYEDFTITASTESTLGFMVAFGSEAISAAPANTDNYSAANGASYEGEYSEGNDEYTVYAYIILNSNNTEDAGQDASSITFTLTQTNAD